MCFFYKNFEPVKQSIISIHKKFILLLIVIVTSINTYAQDPQLFENDWYLQKVVIDAEDFFPPINDDIDVVTLNIVMEEEYNLFDTIACSSITGEFITFTNENIFVGIFNMLLGDVGDCDLEDTYTFQDIYFNLFYNWQEMDNLFDYEIETISVNYKVLTITNVNGDLAVYGNQQLSNQDFINVSVSLYPNPVKNTLQISTENNLTIKRIEIFDVLGEKVLAIKNTNQINVSVLATGLLFVKVTTDKGVVVKKMVKE